MLRILSLNPFMNQVYFYLSPIIAISRRWRWCLNPFMNQVYFYISGAYGYSKFRPGVVLIPLWIRSISTCWPWTFPRHHESLNPFMNQVYFYSTCPRRAYWHEGEVCTVLIPLWIRSISTFKGDIVKEALYTEVLIPLWIRSISTFLPFFRNPGGYALRLNPFMNQVYFY